MKKIIIACVLMFIFGNAIGASQSFAEGQPNNKKHCHEKLVNRKKMDELLEKGYTKHDIFMAAFIEKKSNKGIEQILSYHQKNQSTWDNTARHFGVNIEKLKHRKHHKFYLENKDAVIEHLATYATINNEDIQAYLNKGIPLKAIVVSAAISHLSNKSLDEIIKQKQAGKTFVEISNTYNIDHSLLHEELKRFHQKVKSNTQ